MYTVFLLMAVPLAFCFALDAGGRAPGSLRLVTGSEWLRVMETRAEEQKATRKKVDPIARNREGLALGGYDPVAYFELGRAAPGKPEWEVKRDGTVYRFTSAAHRAKFEKEPDGYLPQFGGYCAYSVAQGSPVAGEPGVWSIQSGRLYLASSPSVLTTWQRDSTLLIPLASRVWPELRK